LLAHSFVTVNVHGASRTHETVGMANVFICSKGAARMTQRSAQHDKSCAGVVNPGLQTPRLLAADLPTSDCLATHITYAA
jgi:hypothetical protein